MAQGIDYSGFPSAPDSVNNFPDWFTMCESFGEAVCYRNSDPSRPRPKTVEFWSNLRSKWGGSCYGFTQTCLLRFKFKQWNAGFFLPPDDLYFKQLDDFNRRMINKYWIYQFGNKFIDFRAESRMLSPVEVMQKIRSGFVAANPRGLSFSWEQYDMKRVNDTLANPPDSVLAVKGHSVVPYRIANVPDSAGIYYMHVYDNNSPADRGVIVRIDSLNNVWRFDRYKDRDTSFGLVANPQIVEYEGFATDDPVGPYRRQQPGGGPLRRLPA